MNPIDPDDPDVRAMNAQYRRDYADLNGSPTDVPSSDENARELLVRCWSVFGHIERTHPAGCAPCDDIARLRCDLQAFVDALPREQVDRRDIAPLLRPNHHARPQEMTMATPPITVSDHAPTGYCCAKGCGKPVANPGDIACADCCALLDRLLDEKCAELGYSRSQLDANLNAYCDEQAKRRARA